MRARLDPPDAGLRARVPRAPEPEQTRDAEGPRASPPVPPPVRSGASEAPAPARPSTMAAIFGALPRVACAAVVAATAGCVSPDGPGAGFESPPASPANRQVEGVPVTLAPSRATPAEKHAHYHRIVAAAGGAYRPGEVHVLALRGLSPSGRAHDARAQGGLHDTIVVLRPGPDGGPAAYELAGSTYPGARTGRNKGPDVTGDGQGDVGMVLEGNFRTVPNGEIFGGPSYWILRPGAGDGLPGVRDTNQDGIYSPEEYQGSRERGDRLHEVLFHPPAYFSGGSAAVNSIGCWNVRDYDRFVELLGGPSARFDVTLLDAYADRLE